MTSSQILLACQQGNLDYLKFLESSVFNEKLADDNGANCCHFAARGGSVETLEFLVKERGLSPSKRSNVGATPMHDAAAAGKLHALKWLKKNCNSNDNDQDGTGATILHLAARYGNLAMVEWILENTECDTEEKSASGSMPIHFAVAGGDYGTVAKLLDESPSTVNLQTINGASTIYLAAQSGHLDILRLLTQRRGISKINAYDGMSPLHAAAQMGNLDCLKYLIEDQKCNPNERDFDGATPLHFAASRGHHKVVEWLLKEGKAKVTLDNLGGSPLHNAAEVGNIKVVKSLLDNGCSPDIMDNAGLTAADLAENCFHEICAKTIRAKNGIKGLFTDKEGIRRPCILPILSIQDIDVHKPSFNQEDNRNNQEHPQIFINSHHIPNEGLSHLQLPTQQDYHSNHVTTGGHYIDAQVQNNFITNNVTVNTRRDGPLEQSISCDKYSNHLPYRQTSPNITNISKSQEPKNYLQVWEHNFKVNMSSLGSDGESVTSQSLRDDSLPGGVGDEDSRSEASSQDTDNLEVETVNRHSTPPRPQSMSAMDQVIKDITKSGLRPTSLLNDVRSTSPSLSEGNQDSRSSSTMSSPSSIKHDFVAELKKTASAPGLRKTKKPNEEGQMTCIYSFGGVDMVKSSPKAIRKDEDDVTTRHPEERRPRPVSDMPQHGNPPTGSDQNEQNSFVKARPLSTGTISKQEETKKTDIPTGSDFSAKSFEDQVPQTDKSGNPIPVWRRQMLARQLADKAKKEAEEKKKGSWIDDLLPEIEESEARFKGMPAWKRQLIERKESEAKSQVKSSGPEKKSNVKVEVNSLKS